MNTITMTLQVDHLILEALKEDISSEDVSTNAVMKEYAAESRMFLLLKICAKLQMRKELTK